MRITHVAGLGFSLLIAVGPALAQDNPLDPSPRPAQANPLDPAAGDGKTGGKKPDDKTSDKTSDEKKPAAPVDPNDHEGLIASRGLVKSGAQYLLEDDVKISDELRKYRLAKKKFDEDNRARIEAENKIKMAKGAIAQWEYQFRALNEELSSVKDTFQHNQIVGQINSLQSKMREGAQFIEAREAELQKFAGSRDAYVGEVLEIADTMEKLAQTYEELAKDEQVRKAITIINDKARPKMRLGPSTELVQNLQFVRKARADINSAVIKIKTEGNIPVVDVTINGKFTRTMILDSGASTIALSAATAKQIGLVPGPNDPTVRMRLADGKIVEGKQMSLKSVRVGQFLVENVECAVLPESLIAAEDLLGNSFLRNFVYKMDPIAGELHLSQVGGKKDK